ncbi:MAG TPA: hypothetical protein VN213_14610 [Solirubrobacteraceae bacterium]|nr:hypothetical protein [Solirubrobacteraceae bacterium]
MKQRLVGVCAVLGAGAALAVSAAPAQGATRDVYAGPFLRSDAARFEQAVGDANAYFVKRVVVREGDRVRWNFRGFHTVTFSPRGGPRVPLIVPDQGTPIANVVDAANAPFWFNGQPRLLINPLAAFPRGGNVFRPGRVMNSGLPLDEGEPAPYTLRFAREGTYDYYCIVHPGMDGQVRVLDRDRRIPTAAATRREAIRQEKNVLARVQRASTGAGAQQPPNTIQAGNDTNDFAVFKFFPASATVKAGDLVTLRMDSQTGEVHTFTFGPNENEAAYVNQIAAAFIAPDPTDTTPPPTVQVEPRAALPSEDPSLGIPTHAPTLHGNGFWNTGVLDADDDSPAIPQSMQVRFSTPGTYSYICVVHPFMRGSITVTP